MSAKLGDILIQQGVIDEEKLIAALSDQRAFGGKLGRTLVDLGYVSEEQLVHALATQLGLKTVDLAVRQYYFGDPAAQAGKLGEPLRSIPGVTQRNGDGELAAGAVAPAAAQGDAIAELRILLVRLEKQLNSQGRAFRALVEILQDKGLVRRGELGTQTTKKP